MRPVEFAVTGSTGEVGRRVAEGLAARGLAQRLIVRDPARAPRLPGTEVAVASAYSDAPAMTQALSGVRTLFLVSAHDIMGITHRALMAGLPVPAYDRVQEHLTAIDAAVEAGMERVVYLSFTGPAPDATFVLARDHYLTEEHIRSTGLAYTFVRPNLYMDKVLQHVARSDVIRAPAGDGRVAWVCRDDVADSAVEVLTGIGHDGRAYDLTGPEALTMNETAARLSTVLGRKIIYEAQTPDEARTLRNTSRMDEMDAARKACTGSGLTDLEIAIWISHYLQISTGDTGRVSDAVPTLCGRPAVSLAEYLERHPAA